MTSLKSLTVLNNEGVRLYELGRLHEASNYFQLCIDEMVKILIQLKEERTISATHELSESRQQIQQIRQQQQQQQIRQERRTTAATTTPKQSPIEGWSQPLSYTRRPGNDAFVFSRGIYLRESTEKMGVPDSGPGDLSVYKLAIQYNKALTYHQIAILTVNSKYYSADAEMAFHMYERAFQSCKSISRQETFYSTMDRGIITMALFNNVGAIFCNELARFYDASECFKAACGIVLGMDLSQLGQTLDSDEAYLLSMNMWMTPKVVTPAA